MLKLGEQIKKLRKERNLSQEVLANYLGVSFQAVSKWEKGDTMPDVALIPAIAYFFGVSTDELLNFNLYEVEKNVEAIIKEGGKYHYTDFEKQEQILRDGLRKYPGNDILLNCLIDILPMPERSKEIIDICKSLIERTKMDDVRHDASRLMAEAYKSIGEYALAKQAIEQIPEIYFTKLEVAAYLLEGEDMFEPAVKEQGLSLEKALHMCELLADYYIKKGDIEKARIELIMAKNIYLATKDDFPTPYTKSFYTAYKDRYLKIEEKLAKLP